MPTFDATTADCHVYSFKEGLLSAVGHDVKLRVGTFAIEVVDHTVKATFDAASLTVVCAMKHGAENPGALSDKDKRSIEGYLRDDILHPRRFPKIEFASTAVEHEDDAWAVTGRLTLHGRTREVRGRLERRGDRWTGRVKLDQRDFGIEPFKAMLGALKIQPVVEVEVSVPLAAL